MAGDADVERAVAAELGRVAVDHAYPGVLGEGRRPAVAEPEVERGAEHEHDVGLAQREGAGLGEGQRMIGRQAAAAGTIHEHRHAAGIGEGGKGGRRVVPVDATAGHHHRPDGAGEQLGQALDRRDVAGHRRAMEVAARDRRQTILERCQ